MKKSHYISPACNVVNIDVECQFLIAGSIVSGDNGNVGGKPGTSPGGQTLDVKGAGTNVWNEW